MDAKWKPVLRGKIYCSPRCGGGCTKADHDRAVKNAAKLATKMGDGWVPRVWENLGWHYEVSKGVASIHPDITYRLNRKPVLEGYTVFFNSAKQVVSSAKDPEDALGFAIQEARGIERRIAADCAALHA